MNASQSSRRGLRWLLVPLVAAAGVFGLWRAHRETAAPAARPPAPAADANAVEIERGVSLEYFAEDRTPEPPPGAVTAMAPPEPLAKATGSLSVNSTPAGAEVFINGRLVQQAPCLIQNVAALRATLVEVKLAGYAPYSHRIQIPANRQTGLSVRLNKLRTGLTIVTVPAGAKLAVDRVARGQSPVTLSDLADGAPHVVRAEIDGYAPAEQSVQAPAGEASLLALQLEKVVGEAAIYSDQEGVEIRISGQPVGATKRHEAGFAYAAVDMLEPGTHDVEVSKPGFIPKQFAINVGKGSTVNLHVDLDPVFAANHEVETRDGSIYRGRLARTLQDGTLRLEMAPGQYRNFPPSLVARHRDL